MPRPLTEASHTRYSAVAIVLHWLMAVLIISNLAGGLVLEGLLDSPDSSRVAIGRIMVGLHKSLGLTVLSLTVVRIVWRVSHAPPPLPAHMTPLERGLSRVSHAGFYVLMLALPMSGWAVVSTAAVPRPLQWFWLFDVPKLSLSADIYQTARQGHEVLGWIMIALLMLHVVAALKHHWFDRDVVLARMLFGRSAVT